MTEILNSNQIVNLSNKHGLPIKAVYLSGAIPPTAPVNGFYVFNMDRHPNGHGTHWVAAFCTNNDCVYFDSFGFPPNVPVMDFLKRRYADPHFSSREIQDYYHDTCGDWCIAFGIAAKKNLNEMGLVGATNYFLNQFDNHTMYNELLLKNMNI